MGTGRCAHVFAVAVAACVLSGCGQSGLLTLPEDTGAGEVEGQESSDDDEQEEAEQE